MCFALDSRGALESQPGFGQLHGPGWHCLERGGAECEPSWALEIEERTYGHWSVSAVSSCLIQASIAIYDEP